MWEYCDPFTNKQPPFIDEEPSDSESEGKWRKWERLGQAIVEVTLIAELVFTLAEVFE
jgi:hypothetical protein